MLKATCRFKTICLLLGLAVLGLGGAPSLDASDQEKALYETNIYRDIYDQNFHHQLMEVLRFDRWLERNAPAKNVDASGQVIANEFFTPQDLNSPQIRKQRIQGYAQSEVFQTGSELVVLDAQVEGLDPSFLVRTEKGKYWLSFDSVEYGELLTSSKAIASRIYHALGYHVPEINIVTIPTGTLKAGEGARYTNSDGFRKPLTQASIDELLLFIPTQPDSTYRVLARKEAEGAGLGNYSFSKRFKTGAGLDFYPEERREIRALQVFASWLNHSGIYDRSTQLFRGPDGKIKAYWIDFESALGAGRKAPKSAEAGHEFFVDFKESFKRFVTLGLKRSAHETCLDAYAAANSAALGYWSHECFNPAGFKTDLPYAAFQKLTPEDARWAVGLIQSFSEEDIRTMIRAGKLSSPEDESRLLEILLNRREKIAEYWATFA